MGLHPDLARMIAASNEENPLDIKDMSPDQARASMRARYLERGYQVEHSVDVRQIEIAHATGTFPLQLYRPMNRENRKLPVLLYFHGGGFVLGDSITYGRQSRALAHLLGAVIAFPDYRLAPEHPFPGALDDARAAIDWLLAHGDEHDINMEYMAIAGDSAGGNLGVNASLYAHERGHGTLKGLTLLYPLIDFRPYSGEPIDYPSMKAFAKGHILDAEEIEWFVEHYLPNKPDRLRPENSLMLHKDFSGLPSANVFTSECDPLRDMGEAFAKRLKSDGVDVTYRCFPGMLHNFMGHGAVCADALRYFFQVVDALAAHLDPSLTR